MKPNPHFPYPTLIELILTFTKYLGIKADSKTKKILDDKEYDRNVDQNQLKDLIAQSISKPVADYIGANAAEIVTLGFNRMLSDYIKIVARIPADGVTRAQMTPILQRCFFQSHIISIINQIYEKHGGPSPVTWFSPEDKAVSITLNWIRNNENGWADYFNGLSKDVKSRIATWEQGDNLPSAWYVFGLDSMSERAPGSLIDWPRVKFLLLVSRAIDAVKQDSALSNFVDDMRLLLWGACDRPDFLSEVQNIQAESQLEMSEVIPLIAELQYKLRRTHPKTSDDRDQLRLCIDRVSTFESPNSYWLDWHDARWHVLSGELDKANALYKSAFDECLFNAGENQELIINEALVVAASVKKPDQVFLKHLKRASVTFRYDIPSASAEKYTNKFTDVVEEWEVQMWKSNLSTIFPTSGYFPGYAKEGEVIRKGPLITSSSNSIKPDYRYPNKKISIGDTWTKRFPQLIWFLLDENFEVVEKLLQKGASVDVFSDTDDTPILMALGALDLTNLPYESLDMRFFNLISQFEHNPETMNCRTQKKRLLPITSAVKTGKVGIVKKVIQMGANPNGRGLTDEQTALNLCLKCIGMVKNPEIAWKKQNEGVITPEVLDAIRRYSPGQTGFTLKSQYQYMSNAKNDELTQVVKNIGEQLIRERICEKMTLEGMREIAKTLIEHGADVNAEHRSPLLGYTPLMLAAEWDERELFDLMLVKGGNPVKTYTDPRTGKPVNCWDIALHFKSKEVQSALSDIRHYFPH